MRGRYEILVVMSFMVVVIVVVVRIAFPFVTRRSEPTPTTHRLLRSMVQVSHLQCHFGSRMQLIPLIGWMHTNTMFHHVQIRV